MKFYENFLRLCNNKGVPPTVACAEIGVDKSAVTRWSQGTNMPSYRTLVKIGDYFGVEPTALLTDAVSGKSASDLYLTYEECTIIEAWRQCNESERDAIGYLLSRHGYKMPEKKVHHLKDIV